MAALHTNFIVAQQQAEAMGNISLTDVPMDGLHRRCKGKKLRAFLLLVKNGSNRKAVTLNRYNNMARNNSKTYISEVGYDKFVLMVDVESFNTFSIICRTSSDSTHLLYHSNYTYGALLGVVQPQGAGQLSRDSTRVVATRDSLIPLVPTVSPSRPLDAGNSISYGCGLYHNVKSVFILRCGVEPSKCKGALCDGRFGIDQGCCCVRAPREDGYVISLSLDTEEPDLAGISFEITSRVLTSLFINERVFVMKISDINPAVLAARVDQIVELINANAGWTLLIWQKSSRSEDGVLRPPKFHLAKLVPSHMTDEIKQQCLDLRYNGEPALVNNDVQGGANHPPDAANNDDHGSGGGNSAGNANDTSVALSNDDTHNDTHNDGNQPRRSANNNVGNASRAGQNYPAAHVPFAGSVFDPRRRLPQNNARDGSGNNADQHRSEESVVSTD